MKYSWYAFQYKEVNQLTLGMNEETYGLTKNQYN